MIEPKTRIDKYRIIKKIGAGAMADVYQAEDTVMGRQVAMKVLPPEFARVPERVMRFNKEVRSLAALDHTNIVTIFDMGHDNGNYFYTMALLSGGDLKGRIIQGVAPERFMDIMKSVADALRFAHGKGLIHRDIKPTNIMFDSEDRPLLTDLGIAKAVGSDTHMTKTGMSIGTPTYMSPEQVHGRNQIDGRSDLYSLGVVLYEALTGNVPFDADTPVGIAMQHVKSAVPQLPESLRRYQPLVNRLLAKDPRYRFDDASVLIQAIEQLQAYARRDLPTTFTQVFGGGQKKSRLVWWLGGGLAMLIIVGIFLFYRLQIYQVVPTDGKGASMKTSQAVLKDAPKKDSPKVQHSYPQAIEDLTDIPFTKPPDEQKDFNKPSIGHNMTFNKRPAVRKQATVNADPIREKHLRSTPKKVRAKDINDLIQKYNFYDRKRNKLGDFKNAFVDSKEGTVTDRATGLVWENRGSISNLSYPEAEQYIQKLNRESFSGRSNWRIPTIEELASLIENRIAQENRLFINPVFSDPNGRWVNWYWSSDSIVDRLYGFANGAWVVDFSGGTIFDGNWGYFSGRQSFFETEAMIRAVCTASDTDKR